MIQKRNTMGQKLKGLSLFASAGVGETYLKDTNVEICVANELLQDRANFYSHLYPESNMICGDITKKEIYEKIIELSIKNKVDYIQATPPCQGFSVAGKMDPNDVRNDLYKYVISATKELEPKYVLIENVSGFAKFVDVIKEELVNYNIESKILDSKDFETPQSRKRLIILMSRKNVKMWKLPDFKFPIITTEDAIGHLPSLEAGQSSTIPYHNAKNHNDNHILWMKHTPSGKSAFENLVHFPSKDGRRIKGYNTTYKRISWDTPAPTITMMNGNISSQNNVHPGRLLPDGTYSDARVLTILELMLLTGLPVDWNIPSWATDTQIRHVLGEAVMPKLIYHLVKSI